VFHSRQLGEEEEEEETIEQTWVGAIDLTNIASMASIVPLANVLALPFLFRSTEMKGTTGKAGRSPTGGTVAAFNSGPSWRSIVQIFQERR